MDISAISPQENRHQTKTQPLASLPGRFRSSCPEQEEERPAPMPGRAPFSYVFAQVRSAAASQHNPATPLPFFSWKSPRASSKTSPSQVTAMRLLQTYFFLFPKDDFQQKVFHNMLQAEHAHLCTHTSLGRGAGPSHHPPRLLLLTQPRDGELPPEERDGNPQTSSSQPGSLPAAYLTPALKDKLYLCQLCAAPGKE